MKIIAMYLPQFHEVKENNEWWGKGFTEWTTVKAAKPLFEGHRQPVKPFRDNYYDLLDKNTMQWQAELMNKYQVDGMCFYHYWFQNGRRILEKPAENLLKWKDIAMPFCFCWANETWARTWSTERDRNTWASAYEKKNRQDGRSILLKQLYGSEKDWREHFYYLLPFFRDDRYIKIDGKPVFVFYKASLISCLENMVDCWNQLSIEEGLPGIFMIGNDCNFCQRNILDAELLHEPKAALEKCAFSTENGILAASYDGLWDTILETVQRQKKWIGGFVSYDDTPRHGGEGFIVKNSTPEKFKHYLAELLAKNVACGNDYIFINAWNEWGEGMYLEPDAFRQYQYLEGVVYAKQNYQRYLKKYQEYGLSEGYENDEVLTECDKQKYMVDMLDKWMKLRDRNINIADSIEDSIKEIAVYGYGMLGRHFIDEAGKADIKIKYVIDKNRKLSKPEVPLFYPEDELPEVDAIVVTAIYVYGEIYELLKKKGIKNIISLEYLITENYSSVI